MLAWRHEHPLESTAFLEFIRTAASAEQKKKVYKLVWDKVAERQETILLANVTYERWEKAVAYHTPRRHDDA